MAGNVLPHISTRIYITLSCKWLTKATSKLDAFHLENACTLDVNLKEES